MKVSQMTFLQVNKVDFGNLFKTVGKNDNYNNKL